MTNGDHAMRNRLILIFALSLCFLKGFSQKSNFGGGVAFGNTFSAMSADNIPGYWKTGITAGLFGNVKLVDNYNVRMLLQMDMNFTMKGTRTKPNFGVEGLARRDKHSTSSWHIISIQPFDSSYRHS